MLEVKLVFQINDKPVLVLTTEGMCVCGPTSCPGHFTNMERAPGTHWTGGWVRPSASNTSDLSPNSLVTQPVA
jgi:hypothetical protein